MITRRSGRMPARLLPVLIATAILLACLPASAQTGSCTQAFSDAKAGEQVSRYTPNQTCPPIPKMDYTEKGQPIIIKRYPSFPTWGPVNWTKYRFVENKKGVEHLQKCSKLKRQPEEMLSEQQKEILREWGQPDYLRGPYTSTRGDVVIEWAYHPLNHIFQFVDRTMVYEGPLTDQDRTLMVYGAPTDLMVSQVGPNIRRETWIYRPVFMEGRDRVFSFANGQLIYSQETP